MSNESINNLIGTFASPAVTSSYNLNTEQLICIDTSRNRIGINTLDPSYAIHILNETIFSNKAIFNDLSLNNNLYVLGDTCLNNLEISGNLNIINGDLSLNSNLYVFGDTCLNNLEISGNFKLKNNNNVFDISESIYLDTSSIIIDASNIRFDCSLIFLSNLPDSSAGLASNCLYRDISGYIKITL